MLHGKRIRALLAVTGFATVLVPASVASAHISISSNPPKTVHACVPNDPAHFNVTLTPYDHGSAVLFDATGPARTSTIRSVIRNKKGQETWAYENVGTSALAILALDNPGVWSTTSRLPMPQTFVVTTTFETTCHQLVVETNTFKYVSPDGGVVMGGG
jgi:hypothetical protein